MIIDYTNPSLVDGVVVFPEFVFPTQPTDPDDIKEGVIITGTSAGGNISVTGTVDHPE